MNMEIGVNMHNFYRERAEIKKNLLPCPFCGNEEIEFSLMHPQHNGKPDMAYWCFWEILCSECGCCFEHGVTRYEDEAVGTETEDIPDVWEKAKQDIIAAWNRRVNA